MSTTGTEELGTHSYPWVSQDTRSAWAQRNNKAFEAVRKALVALPDPPGTWPEESLHARFLDAVLGLFDDTSSGADVSCLGVAVLRRQVALGALTAALMVPGVPPWPTRDEWRESGAHVHVGAGGSFRVWADPWTPSWMTDRSGPPFTDVDAAVERRLSSAPRQADPFFKAITGHDSYFSDGQRLAVRTLVSSARDSTTLVVLPTGSGKTAVAHVAALLGVRRGTALVIVPTVALALDQERAFRDLLRSTGRRLATEDFAYYSGLDELELQAFRTRIRAGEQTIIFAAPESVERSLAFSLYEAAEFGLITAFVIDEAHVVSEWGDEFRPEFQSVAGLRRGLLRLSRRSQGGPFRTLLLTATPTQDALETLSIAFADPQSPLGVVGAPELRLEPAYWAQEFGDEDEREAAVLEAVRHLPRPLLIYATKVEDSTRWAGVLRIAGYRRLAVVNGETPAERRREVLEAWRGVPAEGRTTRRTACDVVIATSAFGLGVDQEDVRAVIHTTIPETIDRFYQEVGRGGRDGRASLSLVLHRQTDRRIAKGINRTKLISQELAEARLRAMLSGAVALDNHRWRVDLAALPRQTPHKRSYNLQWNQRTINLLARAGAVAWDGEKPELGDFATQEEADPEAWGAVIRLIRADHRSSSFWEQVEVTRSRRQATDAASLERMLEVLTHEATVHRVLRDAYRLVLADEALLEPAESCGGCPWCREHRQQWLVGGSTPVSTVQSDVLPTGRLGELTAGRRAGIVCYRSDDAGWESKVSDGVRTAVAQGAISVVIDETATGFDLSRLDAASPRAAVFIEKRHSIDLRDLPDVPTLFVAGPRDRGFVTHDLIRGGYLMPRRRLLIVDEATSDPSREDRRLRDIHPWESIDRFLESH